MRHFIYAGLAALATLTPVNAQDTEPAGQLHLQLSNAQTMDDACQLTFAMLNETGVAIERSAYDMAIINSSQQVETLITFEFRPLTPGQTKVQQFALPGMSCESISGLLINDVTACVTSGGQAPLCDEMLEPSTKLDIAFPWQLSVS